MKDGGEYKKVQSCIEWDDFINFDFFIKFKISATLQGAGGTTLHPVFLYMDGLVVHWKQLRGCCDFCLSFLSLPRP